MRRFLQLLFALLLLFCISTGHAESPAFDLTGPKVDVRVKRGDLTLPVSQTPNLMPGDRLWIHPDLPDSQSEHFILVVAFLRGSTNPPPPEWFTRVETWTRQAHDEGVFVTVPNEAQQALLFLVPETGGDFDTLRKAVRGEPGSFVRAAQDLQAASWERLRLDTYLDAVKTTSKTDPASLKTHAELAARSLGIKINESCFLKPAEQQASCLSQNSEGMVLDDANAQGVINQLANGSALDLVNQLSTTSMAGGGVYSAYVGAIVDTAKILSSLHTAHFQYIPALALPTADTLNLRLNMPPSFRNPKSVVVIALPPIGLTHPEPLFAVNPADGFCAYKPDLVLPVEGAPLVFSSPLAHDLFLRVRGETAGKAPDSSSHDASGHDTSGRAVDLPVTADPSQGGLVFTNSVSKLPSGVLSAEFHGKWGFDNWDGPVFHLYAPEPGKWAVAPGDASALVVGREDTLHLVGDSTQCVAHVAEQVQNKPSVTVAFTAPKPDTLEVKLPLKDVTSGSVTLSVAQYGLDKPDSLKLTAYDVAASLSSLSLSAGDTVAALKGTRLDQVAKAEIGNIPLVPSTLTHVGDLDELALVAGASTASLAPGGALTAEIKLKDGRQLSVHADVLPPRPQVVLLSKGAQESAAGSTPAVQYGSTDDLPVDGHLVFFIKSTSPAAFPRDEKIELAAADSSFHTLLDFADGSLLLADTSTAQASVQPSARFGFSAFGPVRIRPVAADGEAGDWVPLGTLVRLPAFRQLRCPRVESKPCILSASNLFLAAAISASQQFDNATPVPPVFTGTDLIVPHPVNGTLYIKLRDDPANVQSVTLPVTTIAVSEQKAATAAIQPAQDASPEAEPPAPSPAAGEGSSADPGTNPPPPQK